MDRSTNQKMPAQVLAELEAELEQKEKELASLDQQISGFFMPLPHWQRQKNSSTITRSISAAEKK
jgi:hypothetical protein